ncbi:MAG: M23 family metallopeptidase [Spirochaetia bacterium]
MNRVLRRYLLMSIPFLLFSTLTNAENRLDSIYPKIERLHRDDPMFRQVTDDISRYYRAVHTDNPPPALNLFTYTPSTEDTLFSIAARFNLPYETIALLNGLRNPEMLRSTEKILIPNNPGIFIADKPKNDIEKLMHAWRVQAPELGTVVYVTENSHKRLYYFLRGESFHPLERLFFLNVLFRFPLPHGVISSHYGKRTNPFTHSQRFHHGIDIAAPQGTEVQAARGGTTAAVGIDPVLGNYVVLQHEGNFSTIYGHLEEIYTQTGHKHSAGAIIGTVGSTGLSTGPHLHFEIRNAGESWDPSKLLPTTD